MIPFSHEKYDVEFHGKALSTDELHKKFPNARLMKQVHGDVLVFANCETQTADAQWTDSEDHTLIVQTADCLPVMMYLPAKDSVVAIHAGWRGVEQRIVGKSLSALKLGKNDPLHIYIGPHIQKSSFEVDEDVAGNIMKAHGLPLSHSLCEKRGNKFHIDLAELVIREIGALGLKIESRFVSDVDTKTHPDFYSFRDGDRGGRNYSVINKKSVR